MIIEFSIQEKKIDKISNFIEKLTGSESSLKQHNF